MSSDSPESGPVEVTKSEDATPGTSEQQFPSAADLEAESSVVSRSANEPEESLTTEESRTREGITDGAVLNEVRSSLETISNGVEELANTVHDLLGLSDSDTSGDSNNDSEGSERPSWHRIMSRARGRRRSRRLLKDAIGKGQVDSANQSDSDGETSTNNREIIPEIRECNYEQFHSRPAGDSHKLHCLDILIAGDSLYKDFEKFQDIATKVKSGKIESWMPGQTDNSTSEDKDEKWIRRLRINSTAVIEMLGHLCHETSRFRGRGIIFSRPFQLLVSCHNEMKEQLTKMKGPASDVPDDTNNANDSIDPVDSSMARTLDRHSQLQKLGNKKGALDELTCFVDFMDTRIMPDALKYRLQPSTAPQTIRHEDLWYLFKPGDIVYIPRDTSSSDPFKSSLFAQPILRIIQTHLTPMSSSKCLRLNSDSGWCIVGHFIEHDGTSYAPVYIKVPQISTYRGVKKVTELPVYPISYLEDPQILAQAESDGATYVSLVERRSGYYSGWTHTTDPIGRPLAQSLSGDRLASPEHIESDILVDFQETFNAFPSWKLLTYPESSMDSMEIGMIRPTQYTIPVLEWDEAGRVRHGFYGQHVGRDTTEMLEAATFLKEDTLGQFRKDTRKAPTGRFLALLPGRFFAYAVLQRRFVRLNTRFVRSADVEANDKAFEKLEINRNYKRLVLALVKSHFDKIETEKRTNTEIGTQDLIRGKGKGVVILLHGVPGVGKTATAEAVALKWKKPLFPITCGDLGFTAETLEKSLNEIFRLAHHWGCILLLDEADVFITRRERHDLKRNALVSAFLRVLEYYNGIIFLTTNRAGVLDEAVKSRVHLNLHYDHLNEEQTVAIFKQHIQRLRDIERQRNMDENEQIMVLHKEIIQFARDHFNQRDNSHGSGSNFGRWNGRQIRNAFLIAASLAHYDSEDEGDDEDKDELADPGRKKQKQLGRSQFEVVAKTTLMYDQYRESVHGKSDDHVAFEREERAMSSQPRSPTPVRMKNASKSFS